MPDQLTLDLDFGPAPNHYSVSISTGQLHDEQVIRTHTASSPEAALSFVEALRDTYRGREGVVWGSEEPNAEGAMYGLVGGTVYVIRVSPAVDFSQV